MAYNTPESVADYLSRFQMQVTERTKGTFSPMHVKSKLPEGFVTIEQLQGDLDLGDLRDEV